MQPLKLTISRNITPQNSQHLPKEYCIIYINPGRAFGLYRKWYLLILYKIIQLMRFQLLRSDGSEYHTIKFQCFTAYGSECNQLFLLSESICAKMRQVAQNNVRLSVISLSCHKTQTSSSCFYWCYKF